MAKLVPMISTDMTVMALVSPTAVRCYRGTKIYLSAVFGVPSQVCQQYPYAVIHIRPSDDAPMIHLNTMEGHLAEIDDGRPRRWSIQVVMADKFPWVRDGDGFMVYRPSGAPAGMSVDIGMAMDAIRQHGAIYGQR